jgi:drug/metabolite transporter (DMT)-like permease
MGGREAGGRRALRGMARRGRTVSRRGWALFTAVGVIWGIPYLLIKIADGGVSVPVLVFARVFTGSVLLLPIAIRGGQLRALRPCWKWVAVLAAVEAILPWLLLSAAERRLSSSLSGLLVAAVPVIGVGVARLAGDAEPLTALRWAGLAVGLGGVALLMGPGASGAGAWPVLEVLGTAVCYAIGPVIADRKLADADSLAVTAACLGLAAVVYAPAAALTWPHQMPPARVLSALAVLAVVCTALAFILYFRLISEVGAVRATVITYVNPAVAVALGAAVLGEPFTPVIAISFTLILAGSVLATRPPRTAAPEFRPAAARRLRGRAVRTSRSTGLPEPARVPRQPLPFSWAWQSLAGPPDSICPSHSTSMESKVIPAPARARGLGR